MIRNTKITIFRYKRLKEGGKIKLRSRLFHLSLDIYTFADMSTTYSDLGLYDKALEAISQSISYSLRLDSFTISDLYRMKAEIFWQLDQRDSTLYYIQKALERGEQLQEKAYILAAKDLLYDYYYDFVPDSIHTVLKGYRELMEGGDAISMNYQDRFKFMTGASLVRTGRPEEGFAMMEEVYASFKKMKRMIW